MDQYQWVAVLGFLGGVVLLIVRKNWLDKQMAAEKSRLNAEYQTKNAELKSRAKALDKWVLLNKGLRKQTGSQGLLTE